MPETSSPVIEGLVSVLLPVRDWRATTATAINSILQQRYAHLELLLLGQQQLQPLADKLQEYDIKDTRIRLVARQSAGIVSALNTGLSEARGEFIARMDDDDIAYPERLAVQMSFMQQHPAVQLCAACIRFVDMNGSRIGVAAGNRRYETWLNQLTHADAIAHACYAENPMPHPTLLAHHAIWKQLDGYHDTDGPEDHDLILRALLNGIRMGKPTEVLLDWREHKERLTHTDTRYRRQAFVAQSAKAWAQQQAALNGNLNRRVWIAGTGKLARHWHDELVANEVVVQGFVDMHRPGTQRSKRLLPVITYNELHDRRTTELIVSTVTQPAGRKAVLDFFAQQHWHEGDDFIVGA